MSISNFKQQLSGGGARPNQFEIFFAWPSVVTTTPTPDARLLVSGAAIPASTVNPVITQYRGREVKMAGERIFDPFTITIINDTKQSLRQSFEEWMEKINNKATNAGEVQPSEYYGEITVNHLDRNGSTITKGTYVLEDAFPINMSEVALQYAQNDIIEEFTVTFQYQHYNNF
jgi:hypothetical protein